MARLRETDFWAGLLCIAVGAAALLLLADTRMGTLASMGPGFMPVWLARVLIGIGVLVALFPRSSGPLKLDARVLRPLVLLIGGIVVYALALRPAGFALTSFALLLLAAAAGRGVRWLEALVVAVLGSAAATALFISILKINLPVWPS
ncbi:MAG: tripartite tricarboxylate transporter TctB family protein [Reyranellaceae bacterium]